MRSCGPRISSAPIFQRGFADLASLDVGPSRVPQPAPTFSFGNATSHSPTRTLIAISAGPKNPSDKIRHSRAVLDRRTLRPGAMTIKCSRVLRGFIPGRNRTIRWGCGFVADGIGPRVFAAAWPVRIARTMALCAAKPVSERHHGAPGSAGRQNALSQMSAVPRNQARSCLFHRPRKSPAR